MPLRMSTDTACPLRMTATDLAPLERTPRNDEALARFQILRLTGPGPLFDTAYQHLWDEFGGRGEIEPHDVLLRDMMGAEIASQGKLSYRMVVFFDGDPAEGRIAAIRDVFISLFPERNFAYVLLSHSLVLPAWRRSGIGSLIRAVPAVLGQEAMIAAGMDPAQCDLALMAEMDPIDPNSDPTVVRLLAYTGSGFRVVPAQRLPYVQPDFSGWKAAGRDPKPIPLSMVVRWVGHEHEHQLPQRVLVGIFDGIDRIHNVDYPEDVFERRKLATPGLEIPEPAASLILDRRALHLARPLLRSNMLPLFPHRLGGSGGESVGDADVELEGLIRKWRVS